MELSRRQTQRKYPPGTLVTSRDGRTLMMVVGYAPTCPRETKFGKVVQNWEVWLLSHRRELTTVMWYQMKDLYLIEEWEGKWHN